MMSKPYDLSGLIKYGKRDLAKLNKIIKVYQYNNYFKTLDGILKLISTYSYILNYYICKENHEDFKYYDKDELEDFINEQSDCMATSKIFLKFLTNTILDNIFNVTFSITFNTTTGGKEFLKIYYF